MPVAILPNPPAQPLGGFGAARKSMSAPPAKVDPRPTISASHNGPARFSEDMTVAEIKAKAKDSVQKEARGASALTMIRTAQSQLLSAWDYEAKGDLKSALASYVKAASLAKMTMDSAEFAQEKKGRGGLLMKELSHFLEGDGRKMVSETAIVEEKLKAMEKSRPANGSESDDGPNSKPGGSIADRMRALQSNGLSIEPTTKRMSRDLSNLPLPSPPVSPRFPTSAQSSAGIMSAMNPSPTATSTSSPVFVPTSALGPPSPQSTPSSSPQSTTFEMSGFAQAFPSIEELDENPAFQLPSVPTGVSTGSNKSATRDSRNGESSASPLTSFRNYTAPIERPSSTPITPHNYTFASRPASPTKSSAPHRPSGLSTSTSTAPTSTKPPLPVKNAASPRELLSYMRDYNVLLIDVRERYEFDLEHIKADAVVCIEPSVLRRSNVTGDMLEDSLSLAPKQEASLFGNRDKFDLVAIYDASSISFGGSDSPLSVLVRAINEQAFKKMLKRMPMVLVGGIHAWRHDVGDAGLVKGDSFVEVQRPTPITPSSNGMFSPLLLSSNPSMNTPYVNSFTSVPPPSATAPDPHKLWNPRARSDANTLNGDSLHRPHYSLDQISGHSRSPADVTYSGNYSAPSQNLLRRPAMSRPPSSSISYSRGPGDNIPPPLALSSSIYMTNGAPSSSSTSITYPQFPRRISPTASGSGSPFTSPQTQYDIASPPQASISLSQRSRRQSDYVDQSQEALSDFNSRGPIDYPELVSQQILRPPPPAASPVLQRLDNRPRVQQASTPLSPGGSNPPGISNSDYPVTYWKDMKVGLSGLRNLGNTCYMNAPIQCLGATVPFTQYFTENHWSAAVNRSNPLGSGGELARSFAKLLRLMRRADLPLVPDDFRRTVCTLNSQYNNGDQHDSQEFLSFLMDGIHEDLNRIKTRIPYAPTPEEEAELERLPPQIASDREWRNWRNRNDSVIVDYFQGQFRSRLECLTCHQTSTTYNVFSILQLPIPRTNVSKVKITDCLNTLLSDEVLAGDDAWDCPKCKTKRTASKKLSLSRLPPVLLINFKRFQSGGKLGSKIDTFVDFPLKSLDLTNYMPRPIPPGGDQSQLNGGLPMSPDDPRTQMPPYRYDLYGVTEHSGTLSSGHYTAFVSSAGQWMSCDDSSVKSVDRPSSVVTHKAYVLFYKRVQL